MNKKRRAEWMAVARGMQPPPPQVQYVYVRDNQPRLHSLRCSPRRVLLLLVAVIFVPLCLIVIVLGLTDSMFLRGIGF